MEIRERVITTVLLHPQLDDARRTGVLERVFEQVSPVDASFGLALLLLLQVQHVAAQDLRTVVRIASLTLLELGFGHLKRVVDLPDGNLRTRFHILVHGSPNRTGEWLILGGIENMSAFWEAVSQVPFEFVRNIFAHSNSNNN